MTRPIVGLLTIELHLPGMASLKDKRSTIKSMLSRLHQTFNVSAAEIDYHDIWQSAAIAIALVTNSTSHANKVIDTVINWIENNYPEVLIVRQDIDII